MGPRTLGETPPRGGGVYVVVRNGRPLAAHVTTSFSDDLSRRFPMLGNEAEAEEEAENEYGGRRGRRGRRGRYGIRYGRFRGRGRWRRLALLRSMRRAMRLQSQQQGDDGDDDDGGEDNDQG